MEAYSEDSDSSIGSTSVTWKTIADGAELGMPEIFRNIRKRVIIVTIGLSIITIFEGTILDGLDICTSVYFAAQVITTIGYGDIVPRTPRARIIWSVLVLLAAVILAYGLSVAMSRACELQEKAVRKALETSEKIITEVSRGRVRHPHDEHWSHLFSATVIFASFVLFGTVFYGTYEDCSCGSDFIGKEGCNATSYETCVATGGYVKTYVDAFYMSVITLTTVGFGDFTPVTWLGRFVGIFWFIFGVAATASWITTMSTTIFAEKRHAQAVETLAHSELFSQLDYDGDGKLNRMEHHLYLIVKHGLVSQAMLKRLDEKFDRICCPTTEKALLEDVDGADMRSPLSAASPANSGDF